MLFNIQEFEQNFKEPVLKKGLRLFEKGEVERIVHSGNEEFQFWVKSAQVTIKKKGDKIQSYSCSCRAPGYCQHFSAVIFFFQKELVETIRKKQRGKKKPFNAEPEETGVNEDKKEWLEYLSAVTSVIKPFEVQHALDDLQIKKLYAKLNDLGTTYKQKSQGRYLFPLALYSVFSSILNVRLTGDEKILHKLFKRCEEDLEQFFLKGLDKPGKEIWYEATLESVRNNRNLLSGAYLFLMPRYLVMSAHKANLIHLEEVFLRRKIKKHHSTHLNKLIIARLQLAIRRAELFKLPLTLGYDEKGAELGIATAELLFCAGKNEKAFKVLEQKRLSVKKEFRDQYLEYLQYIINYSRLKRKPQVELNILIESMLHGLFITDAQLIAFDALVPEDERSDVLSGMIERLKEDRKLYSFEKISILMLKADLTDELIVEIKKQRNQFKLLHSLALKKLPLHNHELLNLYAVQLSDAFLEGRYYQVQQSIFATAKKYIDRLPEDASEYLINKILDKLGHQAQVARHILSVTQKTD